MQGGSLAAAGGQHGLGWLGNFAHAGQLLQHRMPGRQHIRARQGAAQQHIAVARQMLRQLVQLRTPVRYLAQRPQHSGWHFSAGDESGITL